MQQLCTCKSKMSTHCCMLSVYNLNTCIYVFATKSFDGVVCGFLLQDTAILKFFFFENCFYSHTWMCWKNNNTQVILVCLRLIAYNIRTFICSCAGFLKRYFGSFVCFHILFEKSMKRYLYPRLIFSKSTTGTVLQFCFVNKISNKYIA